jgi:hypothetical protein
MAVKPVFIEALFKVEGTARALISRKAGVREDAVEQVMVIRRLDEEYEISFPLAPSTNAVDVASVRGSF